VRDTPTAFQVDSECVAVLADCDNVKMHALHLTWSSILVAYLPLNMGVASICMPAVGKTIFQK
jgi:hypothetical protein